MCVNSLQYTIERLEEKIANSQGCGTMGDRGSAFRSSGGESKGKGLQETVRGIIEKRKNSKIEFGYKMNIDGTEVQEYKGGKTSVKIRDAYEKVTIHNHPRQEDGSDGGPFSDADLYAAIYRNEPVAYAYDQSTIYEWRAINWRHRERTGLDNAMRIGKAMDVKMKYKEFAEQASEKASKMAREKMKNGDFRGADGFTDWTAWSQWHTKTWFGMLRGWLKDNAKSFGYEYKEHKIK